MGNVCCSVNASLRSDLRGRRLGNKRVHTDGKTYAPYGMAPLQLEGGSGKKPQNPRSDTPWPYTLNSLT